MRFELNWFVYNLKKVCSIWTRWWHYSIMSINLKKGIILISVLGWTMSKSIDKCVFSLNLKFKKNINFKNKVADKADHRNQVHILPRLSAYRVRLNWFINSCFITVWNFKWPSFWNKMAVPAKRRTWFSFWQGLYTYRILSNCLINTVSFLIWSI